MAKTKAFKITQNNQYIQEINLNAGEYTFSANIRADSASITACKFSLLVGDVWLEYDLTDQIYIGQFQKVKKVIQLNDKATKLSLISSGSGGGRVFHVDRPMFEEGSNAGTPKPNELDIEEQAEASNVKITIGIPYYEFRKDAEGSTVPERLTIPFHIFKGNVRVNVPSANIGTLYKPSNITVLDIAGVYNSVSVTILKEFTASEGRVVFSIPVDGRNYEAEFQFKVKEVKDGKSPYIGTNGNWWVWNGTTFVDSGDKAKGDDGKSPEIRDGYWWAWDGTKWYNTEVKAEGVDGKSPYIGENGNWLIWDSAQNKYVDSGDPSHGDDGHSPEIRDGYWWVYENGEWTNTGVKAEGVDAKWLKLNSTATQIKVGKDNVATPTSLTVFSQLYNIIGTVTWNYSIDGANFSSTLPIGVTRSGNEVTIDSSTSTFKVLTIRATIAGIYDTITISRVVDGKNGERGVPGKSPVTKEYRVGQTYYNNDVAIHYVYYRAGNSWWKPKDGVESHTASTSSPNTVYFEQLSSVEVMVAETIIAENANLAEFIFKDKTLFSQQGTNSAEDSLQLGEYVQLQFAQSTSTSTAPSSGWTDTPPTSVSGGQYLWMRTKVNSAVNWKPAERISGIGSLQAQWGALKDGVFYANWQAGRNWMRLNDGRIYALTEALAIADYKANLALYGETGKIFARNIEVERFSIPFKTVTSLPEMLGAIRNGYSVYLNLPKQTVLHEWNVVSLPSVPSGTTISIRTNGTPKIKIKDLWDLKRNTMRNILLTYDINGIITLKHVGDGVWWIVEESLAIAGSHYPAIINAGERIYAGYRFGTSTTKDFSTYKENIALVRVAGGTSVYTRIEIDSHRYYNTNGTLSYQTLATQHFHLNVIAREIAMVRILSTAYDSVYNYLSYGVEFNKYRTATTLESYNVESAFNFEIFTNSDIVQSQYASTGDLTD